MKTIFMILILLITSSAFANETTTVLETYLRENDLSTNAVFILDKELSSKDIFLSYRNDLVIISLKNSVMVNKNHVHKVTDKRILRTLVHSPNLNRVDYRIRFKSSKLVNPELNEIYFEKNKIIVRFFKSQKDMLLYNLQEQNKMKAEKHGRVSQLDKESAETQGIASQLQHRPYNKQKNISNTKKEVLNKDSNKKLANITKDIPTNNKVKTSDSEPKKALIASPAPSSFNGIVLMILLFLGAIAIYLKKKSPNQALATEGFRIISTKSLGNKKQLIMVEANGNKLLLATSENGVQLLSGSEGNFEEDNQLEYQPRKETFKSNLDEEIDQLERSFFQKKNKKNPYIQEEPEVVTHFSKKLKNIKKL